MHCVMLTAIERRFPDSTMDSGKRARQSKYRQTLYQLAQLARPRLLDTLSARDACDQNITATTPNTINVTINTSGQPAMGAGQQHTIATARIKQLDCNKPFQHKVTAKSLVVPFDPAVTAAQLYNQNLPNDTRKTSDENLILQRSFTDTAWGQTPTAESPATKSRSEHSRYRR